MSLSRWSRTEFPKTDGSLILEVAQRRLDAQQSSIDATDTKAGVALAIGSGLIAALFAVIFASPKSIGIAAASFLVISVGAYIGMGLALLAAMWVRDWAVGLNPTQILQLHRDKSVSDRERTWIVAEGYAKARKANKRSYELKVSRTQIGLWLLVAETIGLLATFALLGRA